MNPIDEFSLFIPGKKDEDTITVKKDGDLFTAYKDGEIIAEGEAEVKATESGEYYLEIKKDAGK